jgi:uncharacterized protein YkwD
MRARTIILLGATVCALAGNASATPTDPAGGAAPAATTTAALEGSVIAQVNAVRRRHGLVPLRLSAALAATAAEHAREMGARGYFAHPSADGSPFWKRVERLYPPRPGQSWGVGENLVWASPDIDGARALELWLASPEHRANVLDPRWRELGVAAVHVLAAQGPYGGLDVTIVTADFGVRR